VPTDFKVRDLVAMSGRTLRAQPARVLVLAVVVFGASALADTAVELFNIDHRRNLTEAVLTVVLSSVSTLGVTFYAGLLDRLVGAVERGLPPPPLAGVLRTLPWFRLLLADLVFYLVGGLASVAFFVPGMVFFTLFCIVGPLINVRGHRVIEAYRHSYRLVLPNFWTALLGITVPVVLEHELLDVIEFLVDERSLWVVFLSQLVAGLAFGTAAGLMETALAEHVAYGAPRDPATGLAALDEG
jgi:hypothetical protein